VNSKSFSVADRGKGEKGSPWERRRGATGQAPEEMVMDGGEMALGARGDTC